MNEIIKAGADINAGDGGYSIGTQEKYDEFVKGRNQSLGNERIKELAEQAEQYVNNAMDERANNKDFTFGDIDEMYNTKFAELIVRECMSNLYLNGYDDAMMQIKQHFGVDN